MINFNEYTEAYVIGGGMAKVEGWVTRGDVLLTVFLDNIQKLNNVQGGLAEIGVHHGKYFILLSTLLREKETGVAIDVFEDQYLNIDSSGNGNQAVFKVNLRANLSNVFNIKIIKKDSLRITSEYFDGNMPVRIFSVDGCHTKQHTINDILLANSVLSEKGVIIIDDVFNSRWPGVIEGVLFILHEKDNKLAPLFIGENKLLLCRGEYLNFYREQIVTSYLMLDSEYDDCESRLSLADFEVISCIFPFPQDINKNRIFKSRFFGELKYNSRLLSGFSSPEEWGVWTIGSVSILSFYLKATYHPKSLNGMLRIHGHAYISESEIQIVDFLLNKNHISTIGFLKEDESEYHEISFPAEFLCSGSNELEIRVRFPCSPKSEGRSGDDRQLGFALCGIDVFEM